MQQWWRVDLGLVAVLVGAALVAACASGPVWAFAQSAAARTSGRPWRPDHWTVQTPGVVLEHVGHLDVLRAESGGPVPRQVSISMRPFSDKLVAANPPTLVFSNGTVALYSRQFDVVALASLDAARALPADLNGLPLDEPVMRVRLLDQAGPVLAECRRQPEVTLSDIDTYVVFGPARLVESADLATVISAWSGPVPGLVSLAEDIRRLTEEGVDDPAALIASLFRRAGVRVALP